MSNRDDENMTTGYIEKAIKSIKDNLTDAYASIEVIPKNESEMLSVNRFFNDGHHLCYYELDKKLKDYKDDDIWLTDEIININNETTASLLLEALVKSKCKAIVHLFVSDPMTVNNYLDKAFEHNYRDGSAFLLWAHEDENYVLELYIRNIGHSVTTIRLYEDGNGFVFHEIKYGVQINYFKLNETIRAKIIAEIKEKIESIISNPITVHEDDRFFSTSICVEYGLKWIYPEPEKMHKEDEYFERRDFVQTFDENTLAKKLISAPEVATIFDSLY